MMGFLVPLLSRVPRMAGAAPLTSVAAPAAVDCLRKSRRLMEEVLRGLACGEPSAIYAPAGRLARALLGGLLRLIFQIAVEPVGERFRVFEDGKPAVAAIFFDDEFGRHTGFFELGDHSLRLLQRHQGILVAVDNQGRRVIAANVSDRGNLAEKILHFLLVGDAVEKPFIAVEDLEIDRGFEAPVHVFAIEHVALFAPVEEVGRWKETPHGLDAARNPLHRIVGPGFALRAGRADHQRQMATSRGAADSEAVGIDVIILGVIADEADCTLNILDDLGNGKLRLRAVNDGEDGVAVLQERYVHSGANESWIGAPAAANDEDDA